MRMTFFVTALALFSTAAKADWTQKGSTAKGGASQSFVLDGKFYRTGGYVGFTAGYITSTVAFNPETDKWENKANPETPNRSAGIGFSINGKGYVALGQKNFLSFSPSPEYLVDLNEYDANTNKWTKKTDFPGKGRIGSTVFVLNGKAFVVGGEIAETEKATNEVWSYDPNVDEWKQMNNLPTTVAWASGFALGENGYIVGGMDESENSSKSTYSYDAANDKWTKAADLPNVNVGGTAFVVNGNAYYGLGSNKNLGSTGASFPKAFYQYNHETDAWSTASFSWLDDGRLWPVSGVIDDKVYIGTGYKFDGGEFAYGDFLEYAFPTVSVDEISTKSLTAYPNPASHELVVTAQKEIGTIAVMNSNGSLVFTDSFRNNTTLYVAHFPAGVYHVRVSTAKHTYFSKVLVTR